MKKIFILVTLISFLEISKNLTKILKENEKINGIVKEMLNKLTTEVEISKKESPVYKEIENIYHNFLCIFGKKHKDEPETQAKVNSLRSVQKELMDIISQIQSAHSDFKANIKDKIGRQIDLLDDSMNKEEKTRICNDPEVKIIIFFKKSP